MNEVYTDLERPKKTQTSDLIIEECDRLKELLLSKNAAYGNSVFNRGTLYDVDPIWAIQARINDKVSRIKNLGDDDLLEDAESDLIGYLILLKIAKNNNIS